MKQSQNRSQKQNETTGMQKVLKVLRVAQKVLPPIIAGVAILNVTMQSIRQAKQKHSGQGTTGIPVK